MDLVSSLISNCFTHRRHLSKEGAGSHSFVLPNLIDLLNFPPFFLLKNTYMFQFWKKNYLNKSQIPKLSITSDEKLSSSIFFMRQSINFRKSMFHRPTFFLKTVSKVVSLPYVMFKNYLESCTAVKIARWYEQMRRRKQTRQKRLLREEEKKNAHSLYLILIYSFIHIYIFIYMYISSLLNLKKLSYLLHRLISFQ